MGLALADEAARRGAEVTLVAANVSLPAPDGRARASRSRRPPSCERRPAAAFADADVLLMAAAVADFRPGERRDAKITKSGPRRPRARARAHRRTCCAALAAERAARARRSSASPPSTARARVERGRGKLERKGLDAVVVNDISRPEIGFDAPDNEVTIVTAAGERHGAARAQGRRWRRRSSTRSRGCDARHGVTRELPSSDER